MKIEQIDMKTAMELALKGVEIKVLAPSGPEVGWENMMADTLQGMLSDCLFFRDGEITPPENAITHWQKTDVPAWKMGPQWVVVPNGPRQFDGEGEQ